MLRSASCLALCALLLLSACGTDVPRRKAATPGYKVGSPYQVNGIWYYPNEDYSYDETGIASWYGPGFHGGSTANGETYDANELTAAHPTLPMPSLARVTNLDNSRSVVVRINDRGPFSQGRLIDVSRRTAQLLGFERSGTAKVRVQVLENESRAIADAARRYGTKQAEKAYANSAAPVVPAATMVADNTTYSSAPRASITAQELPPPAAVPAAKPSRPSEPPTPTSVKPYEPPSPPPPRIEQSIAANVAPITATPLPIVTHVPVKPDTQIYVQAGAFTIKENADKLQRKLSSLGKTQINRADVQAQTFYRVRIGPIADADKAMAMLHRVEQSGVSNARIIVD